MADIIQFTPRPAAPGFVETETARRIERTVAYIHAARDIALIVGSPGVGKTTALKHCADTIAGVHYVVINPSAGAVAASLARVCEALEASIPPTRARMHDALCRHIEWCSRDFTLVIDEAQHLNDQAVDQLRCVHDETGLALVFVGNATLKSRFNNTRVASFAQFTSRVGARLVLDHPSAGDVAALCRSCGIEGANETTWLGQQAEGPGGLRIIDKLVRAAGPMVRGPGAIRLEHLKAAAEMLGV